MSADILQAFSPQRAIIEPVGFVSLLRRYLLFYGGDSLAEGSWELRLAGEMHPHQLRMLEIACRALVSG